MERLSIAASRELQHIDADSDVVVPEQVVEFARDERTALHRYFEWDDTAAAREYRIVQARVVLRMAVTVVIAGNKPVRALVSLSSDGGGYRQLNLVLADPQQRGVLLEDALQSLNRFREKYEQLRELAELWPVADHIQTRHTRKRGRQ